MRFFKLLLLSITIALSALATLAQAQEVSISILGEHKDWKSYRFLEEGQPVCFMASQPISSEGEYTKRDRVFWLIAHRPARNSYNVSSFVSGYEIKKGSTVKVTVDNNAVKAMYPHEDRSWFPDRDDEPMMKAMRAGNQMVVEGTSARGTKTKDVFSLSGFTAAHNMITQTCK